MLNGTLKGSQFPFYYQFFYELFEKINLKLGLKYYDGSFPQEFRLTYFFAHVVIETSV